MVQTKFLLAFAAASALGACSTPDANAPAKSTDPSAAKTVVSQAPIKAVSAEPAVVNVAQAASLFEASGVPVDANSPHTRKEYGVIPGARLLTSSGSYDCAAELPQDKGTPLIFYCGNEHCSASDSAAKRAMEAGYVNVKILRAGIMGWKESGQKTETPTS